METITNLNLRDFKNLEDLKEYLKKLKYSDTGIFIHALYGFDYYEKELIKQWELIHKEKDLTHKQIISNSSLKGLEQNPKSGIKESNIKIQADDIPQNNINKKCKIFNEDIIKDGTEGIIKDVVKKSEKYVIITGYGNINYVNFENAIVTEPEEWKDIIIQGYDKDLEANYKIIVAKENITVETWCDDMFQEKNDTYTLELDKKIYEKINNDLKEHKNTASELVILPNGETFELIERGGYTLVPNIPRECKIISHDEAEKILSQGAINGLPYYENNTYTSKNKFLTNREKVIEYILTKTKIAKIQKEYEDVCENIKELEDKKNKLQNDYEEFDKQAGSLLKELV